MRKEELYLNNYIEVISNHISNKDEIMLYAELPTTIVYKGKGNINEEYCKEHNIQVYNSVDFGGGIVGFEGDIVIIMLKQDGFNLGYNFITEVTKYLISQGLNATIKENDILIDNKYKVASYSSTDVGNRCIYTGIQITFNADNEVIKNICLKDSVKIPRGLSYYNINKQDILDIMNKYSKEIK